MSKNDRRQTFLSMIDRIKSEQGVTFKAIALNIGMPLSRMKNIRTGASTPDLEEIAILNKKYPLEEAPEVSTEAPLNILYTQLMSKYKVLESRYFKLQDSYQKIAERSMT